MGMLLLYYMISYEYLLVLQVNSEPDVLAVGAADSLQQMVCSDTLITFIYCHLIYITCALAAKMKVGGGCYECYVYLCS